jgi:hypothetical protein
MIRCFKKLMVGACRGGAIVTAFLILCFCTASHAYNHPELRWSTVESAHFLVHYYENTEPYALPALAIAEEVYPFLNGQYGLWFDKKVDIVLVDYDDMSNGFADWLGGSVEIWTPDLVFPFRGSTTWLRNVITHELTHIVTMQKSRGSIQMMDMAASVGIHNPGLELSFGKTLPMMKLFPMWFAEGLAQNGSYRCGNDCWDSRRDMVLRCAVLGGNSLTLDQMGVFTHDLLGNELVYNQGFSLVKHIEKVVGSECIHRMLREANSGSWDAFAAFSRNPIAEIGSKKIENYYSEWHDSLLLAAKKALPMQPTKTKVIWRQGKLNQQPRISPDGRFWGWLSNNGDDFDRTDLVIARRGKTEPLLIIKRAETSWDFSPDGEYAYFIKSYDPGRHGSFFKELYRCCLKDGRIEQLSKGGRIYAVAASPSNKELAVVRFNHSRFSLEFFDLFSSTFRVIEKGISGDPFIALDYNPGDASKLVVERCVKGRSALLLVDLSGGKTAQLSSGSGQEESPFWASDNRIYFSADYDGIFNIYSLRPDGSDLMRHTSMIGGAFEAVTEDSGTTLLFSEYTSSGFSIVRTSFFGSPYTVAERPQCYFLPLVDYNKGGINQAEPYHLRMQRATWESQITVDVASSGSYSASTLDFGIIRQQNDALQRFIYFLGADFAAGEVSVDTSGALNYTRRGSYFSILSGARRTAMVSSIMDSVPGVRHNLVERMRRTLCTLPALRTSDRQPMTAVSPVTVPIIQMIPQCGFALTSLTPSIQSMAAINLINFTPLLFKTMTDISLQTGHSAFVGTTLLTDVVCMRVNAHSFTRADSIKTAPAGAALPFWFSMQNIGYYNEDIQHNFNNVGEVRFDIVPSYMPGYVDEDSGIRISEPLHGISGRMSFFHAFPVTKYSGIPFEFSGGVSYFEFPVNQSLIDTFSLAGNSDLYCRARAALFYNFPVFRTIDYGQRLFFDALYARIGYSFSVTANRSFLVRMQNQKNVWPELFRGSHSANGPDTGVAVSHVLYCTAEMNSIGEFIFPGGVECTFAYDISRQMSALYVSAKF